MSQSPLSPNQPPGFASPRTVAEYRKLYEMSLKDWLVYHQQQIVFFQCSWMGVKALKNPMDAWIYQELIHEVQPDIFVEIGSAHGGSTLYFAHLFDHLGKGTVVSIDLSRENFEARHPRIVTLTGDSSSREVLDRVANLCAGKRTMVLHDGDHTKDAVLRELRTYSPFVSVGSYFIVEDGIVDLFEADEGMGFEGEGPMRAVEEFLRENSNFQVDDRCERYLLTYNPMGFLKRVR